MKNRMNDVRSFHHQRPFVAQGQQPKFGTMMIQYRNNARWRAFVSVRLAWHVGANWNPPLSIFFKPILNQRTIVGTRVRVVFFKSNVIVFSLSHVRNIAFVRINAGSGDCRVVTHLDNHVRAGTSIPRRSQVTKMYRLPNKKPSFCSGVHNFCPISNRFNILDTFLNNEESC